MELVTLYDTNFRDPAKTLRKIADEIERGDFGEVGSCAIVVMGDKLEVFACGPDAEGPSTAMLLHAGFSRLSRALEDHGR